MPAYNPAEIHALFSAAFNAGDVEAMTALFEPNAILVVSGKSVSGHENIRTVLTEVLQRPGKMTLETRSVVESMQGLAVMHSGWVVERAGETGTPVVTRGLSTEVVRKQPDGTWLFVIDNPFTPQQPVAKQ